MITARLPARLGDVITSRHDSTGRRAGALWVAAVGAFAGLSIGNVARADEDATASEVVVTAQRRAENIQDVPLSISVFTPQQLTDLRIEKTEDLASYTPGLYASTSQFGDPVFSLRGVGMNNGNTNQNPAVTEYINEVALPSIGLLGFDTYDLERIEVLKGPQGDLYGRNTTGGAVNFITARPSHDFSASIDSDYGNYNLTEFGFEVGGGVTDTLALRFAGHAISRDGWQTVVATNNLGGYSESRNGDISRQAARFSALWTPSDSFSALFVGDMTADNSQVPSYLPKGYTNPGGGCKVALAPGFNGGTGCPVYALPTPTGTPVAAAYGGDDPTIAFGANSYGDRNNAHIYGGSLKLEWLFDGMTLTSISGGRKMDRSYGSSSGSPYVDQDLKAIEQLKTLSEEIRLSSSGDGSLQWVGGVYASHDVVDNLNLTNFAQNPAIASLNPTPILFNAYTAQTTEIEAVFGHIEYAFNDEWKAIAGLRETHEHIDYIYSSGVNVDFPPEDQLTPVPYDHANLSENGVSGKVGLNFTPSKDLLLYLTFSDGYKGGGFPGDIAFLPFPAGQPASAYLPAYSSEHLLAYELGSKATLADGALVLNSSVFYYDWRHMQASTEIPYGTPPNVIEVFSLGNAGNAKLYGLDSDLTWKMTSELSLQAGVNLLRSRIMSGAYNGDMPVQSPKFSTNVVMRWQSAQSIAGTRPFAQADYNYRTSVFFTLPNVNQDSQGGYGVLGLRAGVKSDDGKWEWSGWARNVGNKGYLVDAFGSGSTFLADRQLEADPRTFGLSVRYQY